MSSSLYRSLLMVTAGLLIGLSGAGIAAAQPTKPAGPTTTSSPDELADMVLDVIEHEQPVAPTPSPVPAPPR